jgi:hypothetical protein
MSDMSAQPDPAAAPESAPMDEAGQALLQVQLDAARVTAQKAAGAVSAQEAKDFADASLKMAQAIVMLDPNRMAGGDTPEARKASTPQPATRDTDRDGKVGER